MSGFRGGPWSEAEHEGMLPVEEGAPEHIRRGGFAPLAAVIASVLLGGASLLLGAERLASSNLGTTLRARACDASPLLGLGLLCVGGVLLTTATALQVRLTRPNLHLRVDLGALIWALPIPALLTAATLPGVLGCRVTQRFADLVLLGDSLVGMSGAMLAAASAALVGVALGSAWRIEGTVIVGTHGEDATTTVIEQAIADAHDPHTGRFRGVDG